AVLHPMATSSPSIFRMIFGEVEHRFGYRNRKSTPGVSPTHWQIMRASRGSSSAGKRPPSTGQSDGSRRAVRKVAEDFRLLVDSIRDYAIFHLDTDGRVATWNLGARRIKGYLKEEIIGKHFSVFYPPEDIAAGKPEEALA